MKPKSAGLRPRLLLFTILLGILVEMGVFFAALLVSGAYVLATVATLAVLVVAVGFVWFGGRRAGPARND